MRPAGISTRPAELGWHFAGPFLRTECVQMDRSISHIEADLARVNNERNEQVEIRKRADHRVRELDKIVKAFTTELIECQKAMLAGGRRK